MSNAALNRSIETLNKLRLASSKPIILYNKNKEIIKYFNSIKEASLYFKADHKTITKYINSQNLYKNNYYLNQKKKD